MSPVHQASRDTGGLRRLPPVLTGERRFTIHYGFALLATFALLGTAIPSVLFTAHEVNAISKDPDSAEFGVTFAILWSL